MAKQVLPNILTNQGHINT